MTYLEALAAELHAVGIRGRLHDRILAEAADHLAEGDPALFGDPRELAQQFADELATDRARRAAFATFGVLAATGLCFAAAWLFLASAGWAAGMSAGAWTPLGVAGAIGMIVFPQFTFAAGLAMILRAHRRRREPRLPAAEVALLLRRARFALGFDALTIASVVAYAVAFHSKLALWYLVSVPAGAAALAAGAVVAARASHAAAVVKSSVPGEPGDVFDDLPLDLGGNTRLLVAGTAIVTALAALVAGGVTNEGPRNALAELVLVLAGWFGLGKRLGLRR